MLAGRLFSNLPTCQKICITLNDQTKVSDGPLSEKNQVSSVIIMIFRYHFIVIFDNIIIVIFLGFDERCHFSPFEQRTLIKPIKPGKLT